MANLSVSLLMYGLSVVRHPMMSPDGIAASSSVAAGGKSPVLRKCRNHHYLFK
jgi:hypothetical protein